MELKMKFFEPEEWSIHGTINSAIILTLLMLTKQNIDLQTLIIVSLIGMMDGSILSKLIFTFFICLLIYRKSAPWAIKTCIFLIGAFITSNVPYDNKLHKLIETTPGLLWMFRLLIVAWFIYIGKLMVDKK